MEITGRKYLEEYMTLVGNRITELIRRCDLLGKLSWKLPTEEYYMKNRKRYYETLDLGANYYDLDEDGCMGFLAMLQGSMKMNDE
jgi:hypothetical protein